MSAGHMQRGAPVRVLVVDDSSIFRLLLVRSLRADRGIEVIGEAGSAEEAGAFVAHTRPDVITLDLEMPGAGGMVFLRDTIARLAIPTIVISSLTQRGARRSIEALEAGAVDVMAKPDGIAPGRPDHAGLAEIALRIKGVARARTRAAAPPAPALTEPATARTDPPATPPLRAPQRPGRPGEPVILLGASTGGVQALGTVLGALPADCPPVAIVQHMPEGFTDAFARRLNDACRPAIREAQHGDALERGTVLIAPGGTRHMELRGSATGALRVELVPGDPISYSRPAVDALFQSAARIAAPRVVAAVLTGMGADGAAGLVALRRGGAQTFVQDEATALIWGMPGQAWRQGGAQEQVPLGEIAGRLLAAIGMKPASPAPGEPHAAPQSIS
ncbi:chemotaxis-specific protein-glutamate methyltransferase CheB [Roseovarius aquimarinus]|uniref:Protein-glutamate methylesterase/protein-glutamine glutaminase n=1 Tax=Roseovarius aquimarinus TaxID=1229156 RepID=A0ABW7I787_9RHOB